MSLQATEQSASAHDITDRATSSYERVASALERGRAAEALAAIPDLLHSFSELQAAFPDSVEVLQGEEARLLRRLLQPIRDQVRNIADEGVELQARGRLAEEALEFTRRIRLLPEVPPWVDSIESAICRLGALQWRALRQRGSAPSPSLAMRSEFELLLRVAQLDDPIAVWVQNDLNRLLGVQITMALEGGGLSPHLRMRLESWIGQLAQRVPPDAAVQKAISRLREGQPAVVSTRDSGPEAAPDPAQLEAQLRDNVADWLEVAQFNAAAAELSLVFVPGARLAPHDRYRLSLNLAAVVEHGDHEVMDRLIQVFFEELQACPVASQFRLLEPISSLYDSLGLAWRMGDRLSLDTIARLSFCITSWNRCGGPGALGARLQPARFAKARLVDGAGLVRPTRAELAALHCALHQQDELDSALGAIRRNHHSEAWMRSAPQQGWLVTAEVENHLRHLHTQAGFYANSLTPYDCFERWSRGAMAALLDMQVVTGHAGPWYYAIAQRIAEESGRIPGLHQWPADQEIYDFLAGREVLLVSPLAKEAEAQHRSGRAFDLFTDIRIEPYGLRCLTSPDSLYPNRPHSGFADSLERCLAEIEAMHQQLPFDVLIASCGAYSLPICEAVRKRYGSACLRNDAIMHGYFGISCARTARWRSEQRKPHNWVECPSAEAWMPQL